MKKMTFQLKRLRRVWKLLSLGESISGACKKAEVSTYAFWHWRKDERVAKRTEQILLNRIKLLGERAYAKALSGDSRMLEFVLCNRDPENWKPLSKLTIIQQTSVTQSQEKPVYEIVPVEPVNRMGELAKEEGKSE